MSDVRTCPTPYALDALAQPSNRILAPRPFHQEDQPTVVPDRLEMVESNPSISVAKVQQNFETTKDKGQKRALERESCVRQSLMEGKLLWKRAEIASDYSDLNQGLYKQPGMLSEPAVQVRVHPQSDLSTAKIQQNSEITKLSSKKELPPVLPLRTRSTSRRVALSTEGTKESPGHQQGSSNNPGTASLPSGRSTNCRARPARNGGK